MACNIMRFASLGDFARRASEVPSNSPFRPGGYFDGNGLSWFGGLSFQQAIDLTLKGDDSLVPKAMAILDQLEACLETTARQWSASPIGAYPIVPEFLVGLPDCMRRRVEVTSDIAPISLYVSTACSASLSCDALLKRGVAILALVLKLQAIRPVNLFLMAEDGGRKGDLIQIIEVNSKPLDLATVCFALTNAGFARRLTFGLANEVIGFMGEWPSNYQGGDESWESFLRPFIGLETQDLYIRGARDWDAMITDPITWVNTQVAQACGEAL